jgi:hypothetical protein
MAGHRSMFNSTRIFSGFDFALSGLVLALTSVEGSLVSLSFADVSTVRFGLVDLVILFTHTKLVQQTYPLFGASV